MEHVLNNILEFKIEYKIWKSLIHNDCKYI